MEVNRARPLGRGLLVATALLTAAGLAAGLTSGAVAAPGGKKKPPTSTTPSCGSTLLKPSGQPWVCTFADEFSGTALDSSKWIVASTATTGYTNNRECYTNSPNNISVGSGALRLTIRKEPAPLTCKAPWGSFQTDVTSGFASTATKFSQTYGRFEIRARFPESTVPGLQSALWLWPVNYTYGGWPTSGEIDIAEYYTQYPDRVIPFIHYDHGGLDPNVTNNHCLVSRPQDFHTYTLEWDTTRLRILFDGKVCVDDVWQPVGLVKPAPFNHPFYINLTQLLGQAGNAAVASTPFPATMQVDYVRVWR